MRAPAPALADERDLALALARHHALDDVAQRSDRSARHIAERRPPVAEDARIAVLVGADRAPDPEVVQDAREDRHRVLDPRVLRIGLDPLEVGLGARALDLELRHEHRRLAADALGIDHRPLVREEPEAGEVLDVVRTEEDVAGQAVAPDVLEQPFAPLVQLGGGDSGTGPDALLHVSSSVVARDSAAVADEPRGYLAPQRQSACDELTGYVEPGGTGLCATGRSERTEKPRFRGFSSSGGRI